MIREAQCRIVGLERRNTSTLMILMVVSLSSRTCREEISSTVNPGLPGSTTCSARTDDWSFLADPAERQGVWTIKYCCASRNDCSCPWVAKLGGWNRSEMTTGPQPLMNAISRTYILFRRYYGSTLFVREFKAVDSYRIGVRDRSTKKARFQAGFSKKAR